MRNKDLHPRGELSLRMVATPAAGNSAGDVFRDWMMQLMDTAACVAAGARSKGRVITAAVSNLNVSHPVRMGDVVSVYTDIMKTGHTSITVSVEAYALRRHFEERVRLGGAEYVVVAVDDDGLPRALPVAA